jgi:hypothetical protein
MKIRAHVSPAEVVAGAFVKHDRLGAKIFFDLL